MNDFELAIKAYLDERAEQDSLFAQTYAKENKSIQECCQYIIGEAKKRTFSTNGGSMSAISDEEVYGMAVHYYDEDDIKVEKSNDSVKVTHSGKPKDKAKAKDKKVASVEFELF